MTVSINVPLCLIRSVAVIVLGPGLRLTVSVVLEDPEEKLKSDGLGENASPGSLLFQKILGILPQETRAQFCSVAGGEHLKTWTATLEGIDPRPLDPPSPRRSPAPR